MSTTGTLGSRRLTAGVAALAVAVTAVVVAAAPVQAAPGTIVVTTTADDGDGSLRQALADAQTNPDTDHISFAPGVTGTIQLTSGELDVALGGEADDLTIEGPGADALAVDGGGESRVLHVHGPVGARPSVVVSGLTLTGGASNTFGSDTWDPRGAGLRATGVDVTLTDVVVSDNQANSGGGGGISVEEASLDVENSVITGNVIGPEYGHGGGIFFYSEAADTALTVENTVISDNSSGRFGGGIHAPGSAPVTVTGSIVSGNTARHLWYLSEAVVVEGEGGGISAGHLTVRGSRIAGNYAALHGGGLSAGTAVITDSTIAHNVADARGGGLRVSALDLRSSTVTDNRADVGGGIHAGAGPVELTLSTVAQNAAVTGGGLWTASEAALRGTIVATNSGGDLAGEDTASVTLDHSLVRDPREFPYTSDDVSVIGKDPLLRPLADNGGDNPTLLPAPNSPAIDAGGAYGETTDQRGSVRPAGAAADIGAVELTDAERERLPQVSNAAAPTITGRHRVGRTLHAHGGTWAPEDVTLSYQWLRNGVPIDGATSASYTLTPDDYGRNYYGADYRKRISVRVTSAAPGHVDGSTLSDYTRFVRRGRLHMSGRPEVKGKLRVGSMLRARPLGGAVSPRPRRVTIRWYLDGRQVYRVVNHKRFRLRPRMRGQRVKVRFTYHAPRGYHRLTKVVRKHRPVR